MYRSTVLLLALCTGLPFGLGRRNAPASTGRSSRLDHRAPAPGAPARWARCSMAPRAPRPGFRPLDVAPGSGPAVVHGLPHALGAERHVDVLDAERLEG